MRYLIPMTTMIIGFLLGLFVGEYFFSSTNKSIKTVELARGEETRELRIGDEIVEEKKITTSGGNIPVIGDGQPKVSTYKFTAENHELTIEAAYESTTDSIYVNYFLTVQTKTLYRVDTLYVTRIDTLKTVEVSNEAVPFYEKPGLVVTAGIVIGYLIGKAISSN